VIYRFNNSAGVGQSIDFPIVPRVKRTARAIAMATPPKIDGDLSDWIGAEWQSIAERSQATIGADVWQGPQDLSAEFAVAEDAANVYVAVRVLDDMVSFSSSPTDGDSIELFTAEPEQREITFSRDPDWHHLVVAPFSSDDGQSRGSSTGTASVRQLGPRGIWGRDLAATEFPSAQAAYVRQEHGYVVEMSLPRQDLGWTNLGDRTPEFDIAINDRDSGARREKQVTWSGTERNAFSSRYYGRIRLPLP